MLPPAEKLQNFFGVFLQFQIGVDTAPSLWVGISDPAEEWPKWGQPVGAHDSYNTGDKVSHDGKHWISNTDGNVWEPGVYGWTEETADGT